MLKEQHCEIQRRYKKEQQLQAQLEEEAKVHYVEHTAQKMRKAVESKTREKARKMRLAEGEEEEKVRVSPATLEQDSS